MDKFNTLKMFVAVADNGTFGAAASALGTDPSTISKAISRLEEQLEYQLFYRSTRKLTMTEAGRNYLATVRRLLVELDECEQQLASSNESASGTLRLNLPVSYGQLYILPILPLFTRRYPDIQLHVTFSDEYVDTIEQGIDVSIRSGRVSDSRLVVRHLSPMDFVLAASPEYLRQNPVKGVTDLINHDFIRFRFKQSGKLMPFVLPENCCGPAEHPEVCQQYVVDDGMAMVQLCKGGVGVMQGPHFLFREELLNGELQSLFPVMSPDDFGVYLLYPKRRFLPRKVAVFVEFLREHLESINESASHTWARDLKPLHNWQL